MKLLSFLLCSLFPVFVLANTALDQVCSQTTTVCASYHTDFPFSVKQEGRFVLTLKPDATLLKADLWMQMGNHGHGSSPLKITPIAPGEYDITKAFFVMPGGWQIRVTYEQGVTKETLIIPVMIKN